MDYGLALFLLGFVCTIMGQVVALKCLGNRQSPIVFSIAAVIIMSSVAMGFESITHGYASWKAGTLWKTGSLCPAPEVVGRGPMWGGGDGGGRGHGSSGTTHAHSMLLEGIAASIDAK